MRRLHALTTRSLVAEFAARVQIDDIANRQLFARFANQAEPDHFEGFANGPSWNRDDLDVLPQ
jgi:hypothetical protein